MTPSEFDEEKEHLALFALISQVKELLGSDERASDLLKEMADFVERHQAAEERELTRLGARDIDMAKLQHADINRTMGRLVADDRNGQGCAHLLDAILSLENTLQIHEQFTDRVLFRQARQERC